MAEPAGRRGMVLALGAATVLASLFLQLGFFGDDYILFARFDGTVPGQGPLRAYSIVDGVPEHNAALVDQGLLAWWADPALRLEFFRPLPSVMLAGERALFGHTAWPYHLHSLLWYLGLVAAAVLLYRRVLPPAAAVAAGLLFAVDDSHWMPVAWIANRNALIAGVFAVLAILAHLRWRDRGQARWLAASLAAWAVAFCSAEIVWSFMAYVVAYELLGRPGPWRRRLAALAPLLLFAVAAQVLYRALGFGVSGSGAYLDPLHAPVQYLAAAPVRALSLLGSLTLGLASDLAFAMPPLAPFFLGAAALGVLLWAWLLRASRVWCTGEERAAIRWLGAGALLAMLPGMSTFPTDRLLLPTSLGAAAVVGVFLVALGRERTRLKTAARAWLVTVNLVAACPPWALGAFAMWNWDRAMADAVLASPLPREQFAGRVVLLCSPDAAVGLYGALVTHDRGLPLPKSWLALSWVAADHELARLDERTLELTPLGATWLGTQFEKLSRGEQQPLRLGEVVHLNGLDVEVAALREGLPSTIRLHLREPPEAFTWTTLRGGRLVPVVLPEVGRSLLLPAPTGWLEASPFR